MVSIIALAKLLEVEPEDQVLVLFCRRLCTNVPVLWKVKYGILSIASGYIWSSAVWRDVRLRQTAERGQGP